MERELLDADVALLSSKEASETYQMFWSHSCDTLTVITKEAAKDRDPEQELRERTLIWYGTTLYVLLIAGLRPGQMDDFADWLKERHDACMKFPSRYMERNDVTFDEALRRCETQHGSVNEYPRLP